MIVVTSEFPKFCPQCGHEFHEISRADWDDGACLGCDCGCLIGPAQPSSIVDASFSGARRTDFHKYAGELGFYCNPDPLGEALNSGNGVYRP